MQKTEGKYFSPTEKRGKFRYLSLLGGENIRSTAWALKCVKTRRIARSPFLRNNIKCGARLEGGGGRVIRAMSEEIPGAVIFHGGSGNRQEERKNGQNDSKSKGRKRERSDWSK